VEQSSHDWHGHNDGGLGITQDCDMGGDVDDSHDLCHREEEATLGKYIAQLCHLCCDEKGIPFMLQNADDDTHGVKSATFAVPGFNTDKQESIKLDCKGIWQMPGFVLGKSGHGKYYCGCSSRGLEVKRNLELMHSVMAHDEAVASSIQSGDCLHIKALQGLILSSEYGGNLDDVLSAAQRVSEGKCNRLVHWDVSLTGA
jgi:hypothetical protein